MTKQDIVDAIAEETKATRKDVNSFLDAFVGVVKKELGAGEKIALAGFGTFEVRERAAREGINPRTKQKIKIAASKYPAFKPGKGLKDAVC